MTVLEIVLISFSSVLVLGTFLPLTLNKHWLIRGFDFARIQIMILLLICILGSFLVLNLLHFATIGTISVLFFAFFYQLKKLYPFINLKNSNHQVKSDFFETIKLLSINVYQYNDNYSAMLKLINEVQPDLFLAMETDQKWLEGLKTLDTEFKYCKKIALDNTYGMFFYSKLKVINVDVHYFLAEDRPAIEARLVTDDGVEFTFFGFHPPPPSPTEEKTSKKKDGELMILAKRIQDVDMPIIVAGDFNTVCWSNIAQLFSQVSSLSDARINRGFFSTFPTWPRILRIPIDLVYHSSRIDIAEVKTLYNVGSDHLPLLVEFMVRSSNSETQTESNKVKKEVEEIIEEGKKAEVEE